ncbi:RnfH family protein [Dasania sp. GY-MA-18]|uniref:UPF0125 protein O0V09_00690 n=1 Tax=Dasania phycosphaerae TaxID=2950436 RepID=A0A9J6RGB9_9GAMM|nr:MULTISPECIES: RnfH family protein [Dasania]MCR8921266.1 RnfH family protein [Dasania sp. GY-MA-18]MCZ0863694.1 RnfH family protein [Dasania phycosphaerae]MCZ0867422.1 RnfH family protein [Dasania phycosphaerae]
MSVTPTITIEVAYALPNKQKIIALEVAEGTTVYEGAMASGMEQFFPGLSIADAKLGIFGKAVAKPQQQTLRDGDRVEIYRPLLIDPKEVRKARAEKVKAEKAEQKNARQ